MLPRLIGIVFIVIKQCIAEEFNPSSQSMIHAMEQAKQMQKDSAKFINKGSVANILGSIPNRQSCSSNGLRAGKNANQGCKKNIAIPSSENDKSTQILVFVSFSLPELTLKALFQDASSHNAVLIMRGLYQDSFVKTAHKLQGIGLTIEINPELFEKHHIKIVPTFILVSNNHPICQLKGNVTLKFAAQKFRDQFIEKPEISLESKGALCS